MSQEILIAPSNMTKRMASVDATSSSASKYFESTST